MMDVVTKEQEPAGPVPEMGAARDAVDKLVRGGLLDELMAQVDEGSLQLTGQGTAPATPGTGPRVNGWAPRSAMLIWLPRGTVTAPLSLGWCRRASGGSAAVRDDHQPVCRGDDDPRHSGAFGTHPGHRAEPRDDRQHHRRGRRGGQSLAGPAVGTDLSDLVLGRVGGESP